MTGQARIAMLLLPTPQAWSIVNAVAEAFGPITVIVEEPVPKTWLIRARMRRLGIVAVSGQLVFLVLLKFLDRFSRPRIAEIVAQENLKTDPPRETTVIPVELVNSPACIEALRSIDPAVVLVVSTRLLSPETLKSIGAPVMNLHSGINPKYRGQAGGYWALANCDSKNAGVTVHLVDAGVDTGRVLYQAPFKATERDSFTTYYFLQAAAARPLCVKAIEDALAGTLRPIDPALPSLRWDNPTIWFYLWTALKRGVW